MTSDRPAEVVLEALELARAGSFAAIRDLFAPQLQSHVVPEALAEAWEAELQRQGEITTVGTAVVEPVPPAGMLVKLPVTCRHGGFTIVGTVADDGRLLGLQLAPLGAAEPIAPWQPPSYADPASFEEHEVTLESGPRSVPGTLTAPLDRARPGAAVVVLAGSGSLDRDETIGRNKPLKDIAWGLASRGITVVRFDKVTYTHAGDLKDAQNFTLSDEYLPQAIAAIRLLQQHPTVDPDRIFVLGHSLGGTVAPRIAAEEPSVAGLILLAGGTQPLHWTIVRQARHLASLNSVTARAAQPAIERSPRKPSGLTAPTSASPRRQANSPSAHPPPTGSTSATTNPPSSPPPSTDPSSSSKAAATTRSPSTMTSPAGSKHSPVMTTSPCTSTRRSTTSSAPAKDRHRQPSTSRPNTSTPPSSPTSSPGCTRSPTEITDRAPLTGSSLASAASTGEDVSLGERDHRRDCTSSLSPTRRGGPGGWSVKARPAPRPRSSSRAVRARRSRRRSRRAALGR